MGHLQFTFDLVMTGNGFKQISIPSGMNFVSIINNTDNTIELYQDSVTSSGDGKLLLKVPMYTALTIPINQRTDFSFVYTNGGANTTKTVHVIFSEESLGINTPLGSNASLGNVTITGDNVNLAKGSQLPSTLSGGGNLKVDVQNLPATQTVSGTVGVNNFPATQTVSGTVGVNNFPATQKVNSSLTGATAITPNDTGNFTVTNGVYVGGAGDLKVDMSNGETVTFSALPIGFFPFAIKRVYATGTTATNILGLS